MFSRLSRFQAFVAAALTFLFCGSALALPGFYVGKGSADRVNHSTHVVMMKRGNVTVVSVMPDYEGELEPFAIVMPVPSDVTGERVTTLKREFVDRVDQISAPRFHEFWEMDPCDSDKVEQEWERSLKASGDTAFLGGMKFGDGDKVAKELYMDVEAKKKEGEYTLSVIDGAAFSDWLKKKGFAAPEGVEAKLKTYVARGMKLLVAEVDTNRIELVGGERAQLSPIRFWTEQPYDSLPSTLGLSSAPEFQELIVYVLHPEQRFEVKNYETITPPTNINVDFEVKERVGEFYNALYDRIKKKHPKAFLAEYAWSSEGCGQPCPNEPLLIHEILSLGADAFEQQLPEDERDPEPPPMTDEEKEKLKALLETKQKPKEKKEAEEAFKEERRTVHRRRLMVERNKYVLSRLHYRFDKQSLPEDPKLGPASGHIEGGTSLPKGPSGEASSKVGSAKTSRFQTRFNNLHPNKTVVKCDNPKHHRWGKAPRTYRGLRKIWVADDLTRKSRTQIKPEEVVQTAVPELELVGAEQAKKDAKKAAEAAAAAEAAKNESSCGCRVPGVATTSAFGVWGVLAGLGVAFLRRRRSA